MDKKIINTQTVEILRKWAIGRDLRERKSIVKVEYSWMSWGLHMFIIMVDCYILGKIAK